MTGSTFSLRDLDAATGAAVRTVTFGSSKAFDRGYDRLGHIAMLTAGDVAIADGAATITAATGTITLAASGDTLICGPCALARWLRVLDMTVTYPDRYVIDSVIARAAALSANSPHLCRGTYTVTDATRQMPLLPPIDRWGLISAIPAQRGHRDARPGDRPRSPRQGPRPPTTRHPRAVGPLRDRGPSEALR